MVNGGCPGNGWSIISSAATNSQLAGVLAGFVFSAIVILFVRPGAKSTQALGLFAAAFIVLGFDSYLFSLVAGGSTDRYCLRVWSEGMAASGLLGVGGVVVVSGICWLLSTHLDSATGGKVTPADRIHMIKLDRLSRVMVHGVILGVALLLTSTTLD